MPRLDKDIHRLNSFLRSELSAVETYDQALRRLGDAASFRRALRAARDSHRRRAEQLEQAIEDVGGVPTQVFGVWGGFARLVEAGTFTRTAALAALQRGEQYVSSDYQQRRDDDSPWVRSILDVQLVPPQRESLAVITKLAAAWAERRAAAQRQAPVPEPQHEGV